MTSSLKAALPPVSPGALAVCCGTRNEGGFFGIGKREGVVAGGMRNIEVVGTGTQATVAGTLGLRCTAQGQNAVVRDEGTDVVGH